LDANNYQNFAIFSPNDQKLTPMLTNSNIPDFADRHVNFALGPRFGGYFSAL
jgi:hypothetical protein